MNKITMRWSGRVALGAALVFLFGCTAQSQAPPGKSKDKAAAPGTSSSAREVDAVTFLMAFKDGKGDQYKGFTVKGEGHGFGPSLQVIPPGGTPEVALELTVGMLVDNKPVPVRTMEEWVQTEMRRTPRLDLRLTGPKLEEKKSAGPEYSFSGKFTGETASMGRMFSPGTAPSSERWLILYYPRASPNKP
jgi:hypothetical protein